jgi:3',5'-cyclic AMP phosphodiesterase CpdA
MERSLIVHLTDTHFATTREALDPSRTVVNAAGPAAALLNTIYRRIRTDDAAGRHHPILLQGMFRFLGRVRSVPTDWGRVAVVHTGDVTQAGQLAGMASLLGQVENVTGLQPLVIAGNHDLWPSEFPIFAGSETHLQFTALRQRREFARTHPDAKALGTGVQLLRLNSPVPDGLENALAVGRLTDEWDPAQGRRVPQLAALKALLDPDMALRVALIHHPVCELGTTYRPVHDRVREWTGPIAFDLRERDDVAANLDAVGVQLVLCGHEHRVPTKVLHRNDRLLQLAGGTPCMWVEEKEQSLARPSLSIYGIAVEGPKAIHLGWLVYHVDSGTFSGRGTYSYDGKKWNFREFDESLFPPGFIDRPRPSRPFA